MSTYSEYVAARRSEAAKAGRAIEAMGFAPFLASAAPSVIHPAVRVVSSKQGLRLERRDGTKEPFTLAGFVEAWNASPVVILDGHNARRELIRSLNRSGQPGQDLARTVAYMARQPVSSKVVVLTDLLQRRFYLPSDLNVESLGDWQKALPSATGPFALFDAAIHGDDPDDALTNNYISKAYRTMRSAEAGLRSTLTKRSGKDSDKAYGFACSIQNGWNALRCFDPIAGSATVAEGLTADWTPVGRNERSEIVGTVTEPFRLRPGAIRVIPHGMQERDGFGQLTSVGFDPATGLTAAIGVLSSVRGPGTGGFKVFDGALMEGVPVRITSEPFLLVQQARDDYSARWTGNGPRSPQGFERRDVPVDVALAGAVR